MLAGGIRGKVTNQKGEPLPYATIYIHETQSGTTTNEIGEYQLSLNAGSYTITFQYLGYQSINKTIQVGGDFTTLNVQLKTQVISLSTVEVDAGREDPAYTIMRKAIAKSKYHLNQLDSYSAKVYMKGSGRFKKIPRLFRRQMKKEGIDTSTAFVSEVVSEINYVRPNSFSEKVISARRQGDAGSTDITAFINGSFYNPKIGDAVSPLSPKAFAYYKFILEGSFFDEGVEINKIRVIPRRRGDQIFEGILNIVNDKWSIHSLDLAIYRYGFRIEINQIYKPIEGVVWLPISHTFDLSGSVFGFGGEFNYLAAISDYQITLNPDLKEEVVIVDETIETEKAAEIEASRPSSSARDRSAKSNNTTTNQKDNPLSAFEERLKSGKELTRKEMRQLMKDYEKQERKAAEEPQVISNRTFKVDSMAYKRDSLYWEEIRPVPLTTYEIKGGETMDSLEIAELKEAGIEPSDSLLSTPIKKTKFKVWDIFTGQQYRLKTRNRLELMPPLATIGFNTVEGYNLSHGLTYQRSFKNFRALRIGAKGRYALARKKLTGIGFIKLNKGGFGLSQKGWVHLEGGRAVAQFNQPLSARLYSGEIWRSEYHIHPIVNSLSTLLLEENFMKLYEKDYIGLKTRTPLRDNLSLSFNLEYARRYLLTNNTNHHWINYKNKSYTSNTPFNQEWIMQDEPFQTHTITLAELQLNYWPFQKYRVRNKLKRPIKNSSPEFSARFRKGTGINVAFNHAELGVQYSFNLGILAEIDFKVNTGWFWNSENIQFIDYHHFNGNQTPVIVGSSVGSFRLLDYYAYSTADRYINAHLHYQFRSFLATQILELRLLGVKENLFINYLQTPNAKPYFELGYSIDNILRIARLEFVTSFLNGKYDSFGVRIGVARSISE